jgi:hypothetical protein
MSLSTFNSKKDIFYSPNVKMKIIIIFSIIVSVLFMLSWEFYIRKIGYKPSLDDSQELWSEKLLAIDKNGIALLGTSKSLTGLHSKTLNEFTDLKITQLSLHSTSPRKVFNYLANQTDFSGTVLLEMSEMAFFANKPETEAKAQNYINFYKNYSFAQSISFKINRFFDRYFAFIEKEQFSLEKMLNNIFITDRDGLDKKEYYPPIPKFYYMDESRFGELIKKSGEVTKVHIEVFRNRILSEGNKLKESDREILLKKQQSFFIELKNSVQTIKSRGGKVILVKYPISGKIKEYSEKIFPYHLYWGEKGAFSNYGFNYLFHYNDIVDDRKIQCCADELHLSKEDAKLFTKELAETLVKNKIL